MEGSEGLDEGARDRSPRRGEGRRLTRRERGSRFARGCEGAARIEEGLMDPRTKCKAVRSPRGATVTEIDWGDGHKGIYPHEILRGYCPCAGCQGHSGTIAFVKPSSGNQVELDAIEPVGNYALR